MNEKIVNIPGVLYYPDIIDYDDVWEGNILALEEGEEIILSHPVQAAQKSDNPNETYIYFQIWEFDKIKNSNRLADFSKICIKFDASTKQNETYAHPKPTDSFLKIRIDGKDISVF